eukprot:scaffold60647_cov51-Cyclotella_meneghiniana.AAC.4
MSDGSNSSVSSDGYDINDVQPDAPLLTPGLEVQYYGNNFVCGDPRGLKRGKICKIEGRGYNIKVTLDNRDVISSMTKICPVYDGVPSDKGYYDISTNVFIDASAKSINLPNPNANILGRMRQNIRSSLLEAGLGAYSGFVGSPNSSTTYTSTSADTSPTSSAHTSPRHLSNNDTEDAVATSDLDDCHHSLDDAVSITNPDPVVQLPTTRVVSYKYNNDLLMSAVVFYNFTVMCALFALSVLSQDLGNDCMIPEDVILEVVQEFVELNRINLMDRKRSRRSGSSSPDENVKVKRQMVKYDRERAFKAVTTDWMCARPIFDDKQFERTFRIKRSMVDGILAHLVNHDAFWLQTIDAVGNMSIHPHVKFLTALKLICYGVSFSAFQDYFQMGESTAALCVSHLARGIVECPEIADTYLRTPTRSDARRICKLHKEVHGLDGMLGSLDVTKVVWENCPKALRGQYQGKEKLATIGLEAVADTNLWIWHRAFGFPGTLNDLNIWERSPLFQSMQDGTHSEIDFEFELDGQTFSKLYYLVDGIYRWLTRFLATISDPTSKIASFFATQQEAFRKDVERAFGVLKVKFLCLKHPIRLHNEDDIFYVVYACIALHNMMVQYRDEEEGQKESEMFYAVSHLEDEMGVDCSSTIANEDDEEENDICNDYELSNPVDMRVKYDMVQKRWRELYNHADAKKLQIAAMNQLYKDRFGIEAMNGCEDMPDNYDPLAV